MVNQLFYKYNIMNRCSRKSCPEKPSFECVCRGEQKYFCQTDLINHLQDITIKHSPTPLKVSIENSVKEVVLSALEQIKSELLQKSKLILEDFSRLITLLEEKGRLVIRNMNDNQMAIEK